MKKCFLVFLLLFCAVFGGCGSADNFSVDYGSSEVYSKKDMDSAIKVITDEFDTWNGCLMYSVAYKGDEYCAGELDYCNSLSSGEKFDQCIVFTSTFRSPKEGGGAWEADQIYDGFSWTLARADGGRWKLLTWGYA